LITRLKSFPAKGEQKKGAGKNLRLEFLSRKFAAD